MNDNPIKTFGVISYVQSYNARTDMVTFIGWIGTRSLLWELPGELYGHADEVDSRQMRAESLALGRAESYLRGDAYPALIQAGRDAEAQEHKTDLWSDENTQFLRSLMHESQTDLQPSCH